MVVTFESSSLRSRAARHGRRIRFARGFPQWCMHASGGEARALARDGHAGPSFRLCQHRDRTRRERAATTCPCRHRRRPGAVPQRGAGDRRQHPGLRARGGVRRRRVGARAHPPAGSGHRDPGRPDAGDRRHRRRGPAAPGGPGPDHHPGLERGARDALAPGSRVRRDRPAAEALADAAAAARAVGRAQAGDRPPRDATDGQ